MYTCDVAGWNIMDYVTTNNFNISSVIKESKTSEEIINLVISGLVNIGVKRSRARSIVSEMCKDKCYDDAQDLFEACFPYIK